MKKILFLVSNILLFLLSVVLADYYDVLSYIKNNKLEYVSVDGSIYVGKPYISSKGKKYYFLGKVKGLNFTNFKYNQVGTYISYFGKGIFFVNTKDKVILYILELDKTERIKNIINSCKFISNQKIAKLLLLHYDFQVINLNQILSYDVNTNFLSCGWDGEKVYFNTDRFTKYDLDYFIKNYKYIYKHLDLFKKYQTDKDLLIKKIYDYILSKVSYDYDILDRVNNGGDINRISGWLISTFFKYGKLVCDGYVKTFILFLKYYGIKAERIVGKLQPIDQKRRNLGVSLHSWVKIGNLYYDPTFDDTISKNGSQNIYFAKPKECFNLDHYTSGWILFSSIDQRRNYIVDNFDYLNNNCPGILKSIIFLDNKIEDYIRFLFIKYDANYISFDLCNKFDICIKSNSKKQLLDKLKSYRLTVSVGGKSKTINFLNLDDSLAYVNKSKIGNNSNVREVDNNKNDINRSLENKAKIIFEKKIKPKLERLPKSKRNKLKKILIYKLIQYGKKTNNKQVKLFILYLIKEINLWK